MPVPLSESASVPLLLRVRVNPDVVNSFWSCHFSLGHQDVMGPLKTYAVAGSCDSHPPLEYQLLMGVAPSEFPVLKDAVVYPLAVSLC